VGKRGGYWAGGAGVGGGGGGVNKGLEKRNQQVAKKNWGKYHYVQGGVYENQTIRPLRKTNEKKQKRRKGRGLKIHQQRMEKTKYQI